MSQLPFQWIGWCRQKNHDKVWALLRISKAEYVTVWARRGAALQFRKHQGSAWTSEKLIKSKQRRGYASVAPAELNQVYAGFEQDLSQLAMWLMLGAENA